MTFSEVFAFAAIFDAPIKWRHAQQNRQVSRPHVAYYSHYIRVLRRVMAGVIRLLLSLLHGKTES